MTKPAPKIKFHFQKPCTLRNRNMLRNWLLRTFRAYKTPLASLNVIFCSDEFLLNINKTYLQHDYYTDVITFNYSAKEEPVEGEIYISIDRSAENAKTEKVSFTYELHRVMFHGVLHLCGLTDHSAFEKANMTKHENRLLSGYFVPRETRG